MRKIGKWQSKGGRVKPNEWKREGRPKINDALGGGSSYNEGEEREADGAERCKVRGDERGIVDTDRAHLHTDKEISRYEEENFETLAKI